MTETRVVRVIGAGTMGAGIAQVAATHGWTAQVADVDDATVRRAIDSVRARLDRLVEKGRLTPEERDAAAARLVAAVGATGLDACGLVIEAVVEDLDVKTRVLSGLLPELPADAIIATNTSSLSVGALGTAIGAAERTVGMHFFNPAPLLKLVEVVAGDGTDPAVVDRTAAIAEAWGKTVARARDVPGFIVNHVARPYYLEAFRILEDRVAGVDEIDRAMKRLGGFRMGPFELTDLIGQDVNAATTRSVWEQLDRPPLLRPSAVQEALVRDGHLGRKSGRGAYDYGGDEPTPAVALDPVPLALAPDVSNISMRLVASATTETGTVVEAYVFARILVALIVQARRAHERGVASPADIDTALRCGVNYPRGPFEWAQAIGPDLCTHAARLLNLA
jgi:3-hydroxybutyryl-CoA dehydrogenase